MASDKQTGKTRLSGATLAFITAIITAIVTGVISYRTAQFQVEKQAAITLSFSKEQFDARIEEYPKLWKILLPISSRAPHELTPQSCRKITQELNEWMYGRGGLVAHEYTRSLVYQLREACANWKSGRRPKSIYELKDAIVYSCRNDLFLVARKDTDVAVLNRLIERRNREIETIQNNAKLFETE